MGLWGATDADESKPKNLTTAEKKEVFANTKGWVREAGSALSGNDNTSADEEVLVAIGGLSASLGAADITEIEFITTSFDKSEGGTLQARVRFNKTLITISQLPILGRIYNLLILILYTVLTHTIVVQKGPLSCSKYRRKKLSYSGSHLWCCTLEKRKARL